MIHSLNALHCAPHCGVPGAVVKGVPKALTLIQTRYSACRAPVTLLLSLLLLCAHPPESMHAADRDPQRTDAAATPAEGVATQRTVGATTPKPEDVAAGDGDRMRVTGTPELVDRIFAVFDDVPVVNLRTSEPLPPTPAYRFEARSPAPRGPPLVT